MPHPFFCLDRGSGFEGAVLPLTKTPDSSAYLISALLAPYFFS